MNLRSPMTQCASRITHPASHSGIALIIVMIAILVLSVLAGGFAIFTKTETTLARNANNEAELEWLGRSGVEYCRWILAQEMNCPAEPYDSLCQIWAGGSGGACATNGPLVGAILDWIDPDDHEHIEGAENDYYHGLNPPYDCKNGPIDDISELLMIRGITQEMYWGPNATNHPASAWQQKLNRYGPSAAPPSYNAGLVDIFAPFGTGKLNINTASAAALQIIPMVDAQRAEAIVSARACNDDGTGLTGPFRSMDAGY